MVNYVISLNYAAQQPLAFRYPKLALDVSLVGIVSLGVTFAALELFRRRRVYRHHIYHTFDDCKLECRFCGTKRAFSSFSCLTASWALCWTRNC